MKKIIHKPHFKRLGHFLVHLSIWSFCLAGKAEESRNPNIIIIMADDMGYGDVHAFYPESEIPTPNLDTLAREGMMFTDAHTPSSVCTPTRYGLLTGQYCWRTQLKSGVLKGYDLPLIKEERVTIADFLDGLGYQTGIVGKWHLGLEYQKKAPGTDGIHDRFDLSRPLLHTPDKDGFDYSFVLPASLDFEPYLYVRNQDVVDTEFERVPTTEFPHFWREGIKSKSLEFDQVLDDLLAEAKGFIERAADSGDPFFLYFPLTAPHKPVSPAERFVGDSGRGLYGDFVHQIDWTAGEIMKLLDRLDQDENTLVIFTSDNGSPMYRMNSETYPDHVTDETLDYYNERHHRANSHLRGIKGDLYEGGHRVPFIARWPARVTPGQKTSETICLTDLFATIVELTEQEMPDGNAEDSYSFAAPLLGKKEKRNRPPIIHHSGGPGTFAIRKDQWKLILGNGSGARTKPVGKPFQKPYQLYNLDHDLGETNNLITQAPEIAAQLEAEFLELKGLD
jgi:arylsulfatase A-like enzyme